MIVNGKKSFFCIDFSKYRLITNLGILCLWSLNEVSWVQVHCRHHWSTTPPWLFCTCPALLYIGQGGRVALGLLILRLPDNQLYSGRTVGQVSIISSFFIQYRTRPLNSSPLCSTVCLPLHKHTNNILILTRIWHVPAKHANRMDARAHTSTLAECAPRFMTPRSQGFVYQSSPNLAHV